MKEKYVICGIFYRQYNSPECFQLLYFDESIEKFMSSGKDILIMGDFEICPEMHITTKIAKEFDNNSPKSPVSP